MSEAQVAAEPVSAPSLVNSDPAPAPAAEPVVEAPAADPAPAGDTEGTLEVAPEVAPEGEEEAAPEGAPEEYKFEFTEGTTIDEDAIGQLSTVAKELNLTNEQAQKFATLAEGMSTKWAEQLNTHILEQHNAWREAVTTDKEIGGDKMSEALSNAKAAIKDFGSDDLMKVLDDTGIGNHPEFIRFAARVGKANSEHDFAKSGKPAAEVSFYDHPSSKPKG